MKICRLVAVMIFATSWTVYAQDVTSSGGAPTQEIYKGPVGTEDHPARVSSGVMASLLSHRVMPQFPSASHNASGLMVMAVKINPKGEVVEVKAISGPEVTRGPVIAAVRQWTFKPYLLNGQPVFVSTTVTLNIDFGAQ